MSGTHTTDTFVAKLGNKDIVFVKTVTGRFFQIAFHRLVTDGNLDDKDGLVPKAESISAGQLADLIATYSVVTTPSTRAKSKASTKTPQGSLYGKQVQMSQFRLRCGDSSTKKKNGGSY